MAASSWQWIYLREDSPAAQKATYIDSLEFPVLRLEDLKDEKIVANTPVKKIIFLTELVNLERI